MNCASCGAPLLPDQSMCDSCHGLVAPEPRSGNGIAGFEAASELGAGRFSQTWLVRDEKQGPLVLKLLRRYAPSPEAVQKFIDETTRLSKTAPHPSLALPLGAGVHLASAFFLLYQYGGESTLADELRQRGRVAPSRALELCAQICEGLSALHLQGIAHLDLKPANVGLARTQVSERAVVLDGATAYLLTLIGLAESESMPIASAAYAAPDEHPSPRSDLYSVGVLLFQLVTGRLPIQGATSEELLKSHREHPPLKLSDVGRGQLPALEVVLAKLMSKDPEQRPVDALEAASLLRGVAPHIEETMPTAPSLARLENPSLQQPIVQPRKSRLPWIGAAIAAAAALAIFVMRPKPQPEPVIAEATPVAEAPPPAATAMNEAIANAMPAIEKPPLAATPPPAAPHDEPVHGDPQTLAQAQQQPKSRYSQKLDRAQRALWTGQPEYAQQILEPLLKLPMNKRDRARAARMMGDAAAKQGHSATAARWYAKAVRLSNN